MTFYAFGLNITTAPVAVRERYSLSPGALARLYERTELSAEAEYLIVSTCNRTEVYLWGTAGDVASVRQALATAAGTPWPDAHSFTLQDEAAVRHVLSVTCGLSSLVLGDAQIFSQVKEAYKVALDFDTVNTVLHRLMHTAFRTAKRVAHETDLLSGSVSVASTAVAQARQHLPEGPVRALVLGAGDMGRAAVEALQANHRTRLVVTNRTRSRAEVLAEIVRADVVDWADRYEATAAADVVIVASGAAEPVLRAEAMPARPAGRPCLVIDLAVPRNVDPALDAHPGYRVVDLDVLQAEIGRTVDRRRAHIPEAEAIREELLAEYVAWVFHQQAMQPAIQAIRSTFDTIRSQEIERHGHRFTDADRADLEELTSSIMQKLLAVPIVRLKSVEPDSIDFVRGINILQQLFSAPGCEGWPAPAAAEPAAPEGADTPEPAAEATSQPSERTVIEAPARCPFETHLPDGVRHDG